MPKAWHIIAETRQTGAQSNVAPFREYFVVAIANLDQAVESLRMRKNLFDAKLQIQPALRGYPWRVAQRKSSSSTVIVPRGIALTFSDPRVSAAIACAAR